MEFKFDDVRVCSVETIDNRNKRICYPRNYVGLPSDINEIITASIDLNNEKGKNSGVMVDVIPTFAFYTQIFCDLFTVRKNGKTILQGKPYKASLRFLNINRILNQEDALSGSGVFYCVIPLNDIVDKINSPIITFFSERKLIKNPTKGVFVRYSLFEVKENRYPDYDKMQCDANPARCSILGSITPYFNTDMRSVTMGRQMVSVSSFYKKKYLPPFVCRFDRQRKVLSLDLVNSIPEIFKEKNSKKKYITYNLGRFKIVVQLNEKHEIFVGNLIVNNKY